MMDDTALVSDDETALAIRRWYVSRLHDTIRGLRHD